MKTHLISLFNPIYLRWTISLFAAGLLLIIGSQIVGITDNLPGIAMLLAGVIFLFFSLLHPWRKARNYGILAGICVGIIILEYLGIHLLSALHKEKYISEGIAMITAFLFCMPGIIVGIIGSIICALRPE